MFYLPIKFISLGLSTTSLLLVFFIYFNFSIFLFPTFSLLIVFFEGLANLFSFKPDGVSDCSAVGVLRYDDSLLYIKSPTAGAQLLSFSGLSEHTHPTVRSTFFLAVLVTLVVFYQILFQRAPRPSNFLSLGSLVKLYTTAPTISYSLLPKLLSVSGLFALYKLSYNSSSLVGGFQLNDLTYFTDLSSRLSSPLPEFVKYSLISPSSFSVSIQVLTIYWIFVWFMLNWKRVQYGRFTRKMKKIWFKILIMIWFAEILLFITFFVVSLICQSPSAFFFEAKFSSRVDLVQNWVFTRLARLTVILWVCSLVRLNLKWIEWYKLVPLFFIFCFFFLKLILHDVYLLTHQMGFSNHSKFIIKGKVEIHYRFLLVVFRLVHTYLICMSWLFFIYLSCLKKKITFTMLTVNIQNTFYLTLLTYVMQFYIIKDFTFSLWGSPYSYHRGAKYHDYSFVSDLLSLLYVTSKTYSLHLFI